MELVSVRSEEWKNEREWNRRTVEPREETSGEKVTFPIVFLLRPGGSAMPSPTPPQTPSARILRIAAFTQSLPFVACMRVLLTLVFYVPVFIFVVMTALVFLVESTGLFFGLSAASAFLGCASFSRNWDFIVGTLTVDMVSGDFVSGQGSFERTRCQLSLRQ